MSPNYALERTTVEDAHSRITSFLRQALNSRERRRAPGEALQFSMDQVITEVLQERSEADRRANPTGGMSVSTFDPRPNSGPFYDSAWDLCSRGILRPAMKQENHGRTVLDGSLFALTAYGEEWVRALSGYEAVPSEYGRFSALLAGHANRFGAGYHSRSQEALACYRAHTYLACCTMCGAAAESVLLALAIAKVGDEAEVLRHYRSARGRAYLEQTLARQQNSHVQGELATYTGLLNYWRDEAAHGAASSLSEEEGFVALLLLLRLGHFGDTRWREITGRSDSGQ
jgi:hypothetical protein